MLKGSRLLGMLDEKDREYFAEHGEVILLKAGETIYDPGDWVEYAYFPFEGAVASFIIVMDDGRAIETALIGAEGAIGGIVGGGRLPAYCRSAVICQGEFLRISVEDLDAIKAKSPAAVQLFSRYADCLLAQIFQSAACNVSHLLEQRAAKWMIASVERTGAPAIEITQEQLASILGVGRSYASRVMQRFKTQGMLSTRRGGFTVLNMQKLREESCSCNDFVRAHFEEALAGVYPDKMQ